MALELFKPFVFARLEKYGLAQTVKAARRMVEKERVEVWDILEEVIREHPVLLNRAPTLHRLGIQAFEPILVEGKAIQLHPLVCTAFNADFDGDQMAVHVPLSLEAQLEARVLMMSTNNILSPASGKPIIVPTKDIVLGLYYLTMEREGELGEGGLFGSIFDIEHALDSGYLSLHAKIHTKIPVLNDQGEIEHQRVHTTPGRAILWEYMPSKNIPFSSINHVLTNKEISGLVDLVYRNCGQKETVIFADRIMKLGFLYATKSGISFGKDDLVVSPAKNQLVNDTRDKVGEFQQQYLDGLITQGEKYNKVIDAWSQCSDLVADAMMKELSRVIPGEPTNSVFMMAHSGARGSAAQMKQLAGMRGLMTKPNGEIIETPIISNFKEGLNVLEYFNSTHGARKGLSDMALKTANSGYLTRRLVDVAQDCIITEQDCGTQNGLLIRAVMEGSEVIASLSERVLGRIVFEDLQDPITGETIVSAGQMIDEESAVKIDNTGISEIKIRSVLTCESKIGICVNCYGRDLSRGTLVNVGEAVGVIAAQSIGEPGTQLTMRTFHIGGAAQRGAQKSSVEAGIEGIIALKNRVVVPREDGTLVVTGRYLEVSICDPHGREKSRHKIPFGSRLLVDDGSKIQKGDKLADWDPYTVPIITERDGIVNYVDLIEGLSVREVVDESTGISNRVVTDWKQQSRGSDLKPRIILKDEKGDPLMLPSGLEARYFMSVEAILSVENGAKVKAGDVLARIPKESTKTRDITGGLPRVEELFEARKPKDSAIICESDGRVEFGKDYKTKRRITITPLEVNAVPMEYLIPKGRHIMVHEGDVVKRGDLLVDGNQVPHDILQVMGVEALANYLGNEVQEVFRLQGVKINDKHIEMIVRQMLQKVEIIDSGNTTMMSGEILDKCDFEEENKKVLMEGLRPATARPILQGITKASLQTRSFFSAASFQETTRVLTEAAVSGKIDRLHGLKENVIVGRLIPVGTGRSVSDFKRVAATKDKVLIEEARSKQNESQSEKKVAG
jgi:DNA-directed RNA polymerase subunit beta'